MLINPKVKHSCDVYRSLVRIMVIAITSVLMLNIAWGDAAQTTAEPDKTLPQAQVPTQVQQEKDDGWVTAKGMVYSKIKVTKKPLDIKAVFGKDRKVITHVYDNAHYVLLQITDVDGKVTKFPHPHDALPEHDTTEPGVRQPADVHPDENNTDTKDTKNPKVAAKPSEPDAPLMKEAHSVKLDDKDKKIPLETGFTTITYDSETGLVISLTDDTTGTQTLYQYDDATIALAKKLYAAQKAALIQAEKKKK
jgi:hypothetical protein